MRSLKLKVLLTLLLATLLIVLLYQFYNQVIKEKKPEIKHLTNYQTYPAGQKLDFDTCKCQAVTYFEDHFPKTDSDLELPPGTIEYMDKYPEICWIFYYAGSNEKEYRTFHELYDLKQPVILDPGRVLKAENHTIGRRISYISILYHADGSYKVTNATNPEFENDLRNCLGRK